MIESELLLGRGCDVAKSVAESALINILRATSLNRCVGSTYDSCCWQPVERGTLDRIVKHLKMSSSKGSPSKKAASTVRKSPRSRTPSDKAVIAAANAPLPSPAKESHLSPAWSVAAVTSASTTPRSAATFAANSSSSSFVYRRTGTGASARAYASVDNSSTSASWSSGSVTGWDAWLCDNASKRKGELFMLKYSVCWVLFVMWIVWSRVFEVSVIDHS